MNAFESIHQLENYVSSAAWSMCLLISHRLDATLLLSSTGPKAVAEHAIHIGQAGGYLVGIMSLVSPR
jgi:hypothetical protein